MQVYIRLLSGGSHSPLICKTYWCTNTNTYLINWLPKNKLTLALLFRLIICFWYFLQFLICPIWHSVQENLSDNSYNGMIKRESVGPVGLGVITQTEMLNTTTWKVNNTIIWEVALHLQAWFDPTMKVIMNTKAAMPSVNNRVNFHVFPSKHKHNNPLRKCDLSQDLS